MKTNILSFTFPLFDCYWIAFLVTSITMLTNVGSSMAQLLMLFRTLLSRASPWLWQVLYVLSTVCRYIKSYLLIATSQ